MITASHNPPSYNGYKLKGAHGGPSSPEDIAAVEALIEDEVSIPTKTMAEWEAEGLLSWVDLEREYLEYLQTKFDFAKLNASPFKMAYDAMYGAGMNVIRQLAAGRGAAFIASTTPASTGKRRSRWIKTCRSLRIR